MPEKSTYTAQDLATITGLKKEDLDKLFYTIIELLSRGAQVRIANFGAFKRALYKGRTLVSPVLEGGSVKFDDQWLMRFSAFVTAKVKLNELSGSPSSDEPEAKPEKPKNKKTRTEKPKNKKTKTKPSEPEDAPEIVSEIEPEPESVKGAETAPKAGKAAPKAKGKPRKASSGTRKAS